jgi:hypothetical protein
MHDTNQRKESRKMRKATTTPQSERGNRRTAVTKTDREKADFLRCLLAKYALSVLAACTDDQIFAAVASGIAGLCPDTPNAGEAGNKSVVPSLQRRAARQ